MGTMAKIPALAAITDLTSLLAMLTDPKKYKDAVGQLEKLRNEINDRIELVGKVNQIERLRIEAEKMANEAAATLKTVTEQIEKDKAYAEKSIQEAQSRSMEKVQAAQKKLQADQESVSQREAAVRAQETNLTGQLAQAESDRNAAASDKARVDALMSEYKNKVALIEETLGRVA